MLIPIFFLVIGIVVLIGGAEMLVRGSSSIAKRWGISSIVIGLTVVAFGTSAPELVVNMLSATQGSTDLAIGNIVGSNMANILLILGIGALMTTLKVKEGTTFKEIPFALLAIVLVVIMGNDGLLDGTVQNVLSRTDGLAFIAFFIIFLYYTFGISRAKGEKDAVETYSWSTSVLMFLLGLVGLVLGGKWIVDSAITIAAAAGLSESLIGLTVVALGTSLPELATTIVAVRKGHTDLAIGNVIGSNIFNVFWILGLTSVVKPIPFDVNTNLDVIFTTFGTLLLFLFMFIGKRHRLERWQGVLFILLYIGYMVFAIVR
ncbi:MAG: calcium/sodium antiporter [Candidatus Magasanikbacteria bacterium]|uniref:Sodium:proton exchanger n=1 Tax=Candidatus Magasanikbacteria bacterium CG10_big_fil_rev_8_21_14_0_10_38_6 TaxID=1974647 RepID=A0A2M6NZT0_9BACT|nr:calcium/sodium antiporter [Candidatus Magasanikbacteria bacterium]NCS72180.1 calcium/sodium antiporter [Candidatus Magasanikbacteria bacterium]PIR76951.1 MAG: sodium:proton exchanger [Candidatus Magasanikbacteria bacterium CG10_big_fil_rev_8_21_14_0_10_38_6]